MVKRPLKVIAKALDRNGKEFTVTGEGLLARCICHELDHLEGIIFKTRAERMVDPSELD